ncbi:MAG TPA: VOC family protein [Acidimicrobiales bacterium]|nr:VOC family protein [Acidimicrobiales bacterium]
MHALDHVMVVVADLDEAAHRYDSDFGLVAVPGGRHPGFGTANSIIPLGDAFIELVVVEDAAVSPLAEFLSGRLASDGEGIVGVCLRAADFAAVAARLDSPIVPMSRTRPDGTELHWELTGIDGALVHGLPFFISWAVDEDHPARMRVGHPSGARGIAWVEIGGDPERVRSWLGEDEAPLRLVGGDPGPHRYAVTTASGELTLS